MTQAVARTPAEIRAIGRAYADTSTPVKAILVMFGLATPELYALITANDWPKRKQKGRMRSAAEWAADQREDDEQRERELYGDGLEDARFLRKMGFVVVADRSCFKVGRRVCTLATLRELAARERRLLEPPPALLAGIEGTTHNRPKVTRGIEPTAERRAARKIGAKTMCECGKPLRHRGRCLGGWRKPG